MKYRELLLCNLITIFLTSCGKIKVKSDNKPNTDSLKKDSIYSFDHECFGPYVFEPQDSSIH